MCLIPTPKKEELINTLLAQFSDYLVIPTPKKEELINTLEIIKAYRSGFRLLRKKS